MDGSRFRSPPQRIEALKEYAWPGNIRELRNVVERLLLLAGGEVSGEDVRMALPRSEGPRRDGHRGDNETGPLAQRVLTFEKKVYWQNLNGMDGRSRRPRRRSGWSGAIFTRSASSWGLICKICQNGTKSLIFWDEGWFAARTLPFSHASKFR